MIASDNATKGPPWRRSNSTTNPSVIAFVFALANANTNARSRRLIGANRAPSSAASKTPSCKSSAAGYYSSNADPAAFILSDGRLARHERPVAPLSLKGLFEVYQEKLPPGAKEESTLQGERIHFKHLMKILGGSRVAQSLVVPDVQGYAATRSKQRYRKRPIRAATIKKELTTLRLVWNWAVSQGLLQGASLVRDIIYPKPDEKQVFRTRLKIERIVARGGLTKDEIQDLWDGLYLSRDEVPVERHELPGKPILPWTNAISRAGEAQFTGSGCASTFVLHATTS
ncbi:MAG: hypothetical protein IT424_04715 [Pirellulales bacterium]|nr:hypothetical protein [Pirellulales bacterium]